MSTGENQEKSNTPRTEKLVDTYGDELADRLCRPEACPSAPRVRLEDDSGLIPSDPAFDDAIPSSDRKSSACPFLPWGSLRAPGLVLSAAGASVEPGRDPSQATQ